jgi:hypothetical protein
MWLWLQVCAGTQFTCFTSAKVQILTQLWLQNPAAAKLVGVAEVQNEQVALLVQKFVLPSTTVQILTQRTCRTSRWLY